MMRKLAILALVMLLAACGTVATPVYEAPTEEVIAEATSEVVAAAPTETPVPPTETPIPATPTTEPTAVPTEETTAEAAAAAETVADDKEFFVQLASAANGEKLFHQDFVTSAGTWQCATCHSTEPDVVLIGPSQHGVFERAKTRIEGMGPYTYMYNSILHSQDFLVPEFAAEGMTRMPPYDGVLSDAQVYDLIAYLVTLQ